MNTSPLKKLLTDTTSRFMALDKRWRIGIIVFCVLSVIGSVMEPGKNEETSVDSRPAEIPSAKEQGYAETVIQPGNDPKLRHRRIWAETHMVIRSDCNTELNPILEEHEFGYEWAYDYDGSEQRWEYYMVHADRGEIMLVSQHVKMGNKYGAMQEMTATCTYDLLSKTVSDLTFQ